MNGLEPPQGTGSEMSCEEFLARGDKEGRVSVLVCVSPVPSCDPLIHEFSGSVRGG